MKTYRKKYLKLFQLLRNFKAKVICCLKSFYLKFTLNTSHRIFKDKII